MQFFIEKLCPAGIHSQPTVVWLEMRKPTLAIIGSGIAGLGCAHFLRRHFDLTLFEENSYLGGHTNTLTVLEDGKTIPIDTGFMVFNKITYPNLTQFFEELEVEIKPTSMSFSVQHRPTGLEYNGSSLNHLFAQRINLLKPGFWRMLSQINRFNQEAVEALKDPSWKEMTLDEYVKVRGYGSDFFDLFLVPMSSAVWSTPPELMRAFPAVSLLRFFHNHGFLGLHTQHPWFTVQNGASSYVKKVIHPFQDRIRMQAGVRQIERQSDSVRIHFADGNSLNFDRVILASHADQSLSLLKDPTFEEARLLSCFKYQPNTAVLHSDESVMPRTRRAWASWNYRNDLRPDSTLQASTHYWMNSLQGVSKKRNYFVSINPLKIQESLRHKTIAYTHPLFDRAAVDAQQYLPGLNQAGLEQTRTHFCGSYFRNGFHEDAFTSAKELSRLILSRQEVFV